MRVLPGIEGTRSNRQEVAVSRRLDCHKTLAMLAGSGIACPTVGKELLKAYFSYFVRNGFLPDPARSQSQLEANVSSG